MTRSCHARVPVPVPGLRPAERKGLRGLGRGAGIGPPGCPSLGRGRATLVRARRQASLDEVLAEVEGLGARAIAVPTNITGCLIDLASATDTFGGVDVLVNNAFRFDAFQSFEEVDLAIWRKIMDTNLFGSLQMTRAALPSMRERGGGSVVMAASMVARQPQPVQGGYAISKGASYGHSCPGLRIGGCWACASTPSSWLDGGTVGLHVHNR